MQITRRKIDNGSDAAAGVFPEEIQHAEVPTSGAVKRRGTSSTNTLLEEFWFRGTLDAHIIQLGSSERIILITDREKMELFGALRLAGSGGWPLLAFGASR